jgi:hypothetical protein
MIDGSAMMQPGPVFAAPLHVGGEVVAEVKALSIKTSG